MQRPAHVDEQRKVTMATYFEMVDAVNDAKTEDDRRYAQARLTGWIQCANAHGVRWSGLDADEHTIFRFGSRPMCCGVLLDLKP